MISMNSIDDAAGAAGYYTSHGHVEYYADQEVPSAWCGKGAELNGLAGEVTAEQLTRMLQGRVTERGVEIQLGRTVTNDNGNKVNEHRAGWDMTFAPSKSVSMEAEVFGNGAAREAHEAAVLVAMEYLEDNAAQTRIQGSATKTGNLIYATFGHSTSRDGDPQTHTHVVVANVTYVDGKAYSLSNERLMQYRTAADAVYKNDLAHRLQEQGYQLEFDSKGNFEIAGYERAQLQEFSKRAMAIENSLADRGKDRGSASFDSRQTAALDTRQTKNHVESAEVHRARWQAEAAAAGVLQALRVEPAAPGEQRPVAAGFAGQEIAAQASSSLSEREAVFSHKHLVMEAARSSAGRVSSADLIASIAGMENSGALRVHEETRSTTTYTTEAAMARERWADQVIRDGQGTHVAIMTGKEVLSALKAFEAGKGFILTGEQRGAAMAILTGRDQAAGVQGAAGTGKTTMLEFVRVAAETKGWTVAGMSNGAAQAAKLEADSGIKSTTVARFLASKAEPAAEKASAAARRPHQSEHSSTGKPARRTVLGATRKAWGQVRDRVARYINRNFTKHSKGQTNGQQRQHGSGRDSHVKRNLERGFGAIAGGTSTASLNGVRSLSSLSVVRFAKGSEVLLQGDARHHVDDDGAKRADALRRPGDDKRGLTTSGQRNGPDGAGLARVLYVNDEASMSSQVEFNGVLAKAQAEGAKVLFVGDREQLQSVGAGAAFERAQDHMRVSVLSQINRQKTNEARAPVMAVVAGDHARAIEGVATEFATHRERVEGHWDSVAGRTEGKLTGKQRAAMRDQLDAAKSEDNKVAMAALASDYTNLPADERARTIVITATNEDRAAINAEIRARLVANGVLGKDETTVGALKVRGITEAQRTNVINYDKGDVLKVVSKADGQRYLRVERTDTRANTVHVIDEAGDRSVIAGRSLAKMQVYAVQERTFRVGDRVAFTENDKATGLRNGDVATVKDLRAGRMTVDVDGREISVDFKKYRQLDHGYVMTSYKAQGQTQNLALIHHNTASGVHSQRETYVNVTRARLQTRMYTQDRTRAAQQGGQRMDKTFATNRGNRELEKAGTQSTSERGLGLDL
jgi:conjugative relaxase-like TrwC/TraI family protein